MYRSPRQYGEAEGLYKRALAIREQVLGENHPDVADALNNLALVYWTQGKYSEAEGSTSARWRSGRRLLENHPDVAQTSTTWPSCIETRASTAEAEGLLKRALVDPRNSARCEPPRRGPEPEQPGQRVSSPGQVQRRRRGSTSARWRSGSSARREPPRRGSSLINLANVYRDQGKYGEAEGLYKRALVIGEQALGASHPSGLGLNNMAILYEARGESGSALAYSRKATAAVLAHRTAELTGTPQTGAAGGLVERRASYFQRHVANLAVAARKGIEPAPSLAHEAIEVAQWANQSSAAAAVQQMGTRFASGSGALASLVRESQDLAAAWRDKDKALLDALSNPEGRHDRARIDALAQADRRDRGAA